MGEVSSVIEQLQALGVTKKSRPGQVLLRAAELGRLTVVRCEMPECKRGEDRRGEFDPYSRPLSDWMWSADHAVPEEEGGRLTPDNVRLAHRKCNREGVLYRRWRVRVVSWNMGLATESRRPGLHDQAWHFLLGLGPDVAFVQEALPPRWARAEGTVVQGPVRQWGSAIFSPRFPLERYPVQDNSPLHSLGGYLAIGTVSLPDGSDLLVASVHAPVRSATKAQVKTLGCPDAVRASIGHVMLNDLVFCGLERLVAGRKFLVAGDWNVARLVDQHYSGTPGSEFFARTEDHGWFECMPEDRQEVRTWFGPGAPYQDDHAFCHPGLEPYLKNVWVATVAAADLHLSHHAPLVLDFQVRPITEDR